MVSTISERKLIEALDSPTIEALRDVFFHRGRIGKSYSEHVFDVLAPRICTPAAGTPSSRWRAEGKEDPHGNHYDCERARLCHGEMTDDEIANAVFLTNDIGVQTAAKERIRWLSRQLEASRVAVETAKSCAKFVAWALFNGSWQGCDLDGGSVQDKAEELGLINKVKYDPAKHGDSDCAELGDDWYVPTDALASLAFPSTERT